MTKTTHLLSLAVLIFVVGALKLQAQTTIAFQGGESTPSDNWGFAPITNAGGPITPGIVNFNPKSGSFAIRAGGGTNIGCSSGTNCITGGANTASGCAMHGRAIQFNPINVACLSGVQLSVSHSSQPITCSGAGFDGTDSLKFEVRLDGGAWTTIQTMIASGDYNWNYSTAMVGIPAAVPNPWIYAVPSGTNTFEFRVRAIVNRSDEVFYLDDVRLTTTSTAYNFPGTAGLWNGASDDNWFNPCNWDDRQVPTALTNVTFPTSTSLNDIVIQASQNCICNNFTATGAAGRVLRAGGSPTKMLSVLGNLNINNLAGAAPLQFTDGISGTPDGTLNLYGNWNNSCSAADFIEGEGTINFLGSANQTISLITAEPTEDFFNVVVNKPGGDLVLSKSAQVRGVLNLVNGKISTTTNTVLVSNPLPSAIIGQSTASYINGNLVRAILPGPGTRSYDFPLGTASFYELANLNLTNPSGFLVIGGFFNPVIAGLPPSITEGTCGFTELLNAGIWTLAPDAAFSGTYDVTLYERGYTNGGGDCYINVKRPDALNNWSNPGSHITWSEAGGLVTCSRSGLSAFSDFAIARGITIVGLDDLQLHAQLLDEAAIGLQWQWSDATVQGKFDLERYQDRQPIALGEWEIGNGQQMQTIDPQAPNGLLQYRLYHTDLNGNRSLAASTEIFKEGGDQGFARLWPNPTQEEVHLQLSGSGGWALSLYRIDGAIMGTWVGEATAIQSKFENFVPELPAGVYILACRQGGQVQHLKLIKQ